MALDAWLAFCATEVVLCLSPGPAVCYVVSVALARGFRAGIAAVLGILGGNALYFAVSATGVAAIIVSSGRLFAALEWAGALYLVWLGLRMLFSRPHAREDVAPHAVQNAFVRGFLVQVANPKALVFFVALLPQFLDAGAPVVFQILVLGVSSIVIELLVLSLYAAAALRARDLAGERWAMALERVGGVFLLATGARLALLRVL